MVDDSESDALLARKCYEKSGLSNPFLVLDTAVSLLAHLDLVADGIEPPPALVLLDIQMPEMDGFEALATVRSDPKFRLIPIVTMLTNSDDPLEIERSIELGADGFFTKPADLGRYVAFFDSLAP